MRKLSSRVIAIALLTAAAIILFQLTGVLIIARGVADARRMFSTPVQVMQALVGQAGAGLILSLGSA